MVSAKRYGPDTTTKVTKSPGVAYPTILPYSSAVYMQRVPRFLLEVRLKEIVTVAQRRCKKIAVPPHFRFQATPFIGSVERRTHGQGAVTRRFTCLAMDPTILNTLTRAFYPNLSSGSINSFPWEASVGGETRGVHARHSGVVVFKAGTDMKTGHCGSNVGGFTLPII